MRVAVGRIVGRHDGRHEVVLHAGDPAALDVARQVALVRVVEDELLVLGAVVEGRTLERIALDIEHRALDRDVVAQDLHVRRADQGSALRFSTVLEPDPVPAARKM
jgi:hypothetical protein